MTDLYKGMGENERPVSFLMRTRGVSESDAQDLVLRELGRALSQSDGAEGTYRLCAKSGPFDIMDMHYRVVRRNSLS